MNKIRDEIRDLMMSIEPSMMITFAFQRMVSTDEMQSAIDCYFNQLQRRVLGRNWAKHPPAERPCFVGSAEHIDRRLHQNPHVHGLLCATEDFLTHIEGDENKIRWRKSGTWCGSIMAIRLTHGADRAASYNTKEIWTPDHQSKVVLYVPKGKK